MKLNIDEIRKITLGAVRIEEQDGYIRFYRFTSEQESLYKERSDDFYAKTFATAGVKLLFKTDSKSLFIKGRVESASSRKYYSFDVFVNGKPIEYIDNICGEKMEKDYTKKELPLGDFSKKVELGDGEKTVLVYFPWSVTAKISTIELDDGAFIKPQVPKKRLLALGDSITQGYDAIRPSEHYAVKLSEKLDAQLVNKGIGGEVFFPELAKSKEDFIPDYITVAYGTNDWSKLDEKTFLKNCREFYEALSQNYPSSKIFAITPIWRKDCGEIKAFGDFSKVEKNIREAVKTLKNVTVISGFDFVPHDESFFADLRLHPDDCGFGHYFNNLIMHI